MRPLALEDGRRDFSPTATCVTVLGDPASGNSGWGAPPSPTRVAASAPTGDPSPTVEASPCSIGATTRPDRRRSSSTDIGCAPHRQRDQGQGGSRQGSKHEGTSKRASVHAWKFPAVFVTFGNCVLDFDACEFTTSPIDPKPQLLTTPPAQLLRQVASWARPSTTAERWDQLFIASGAPGEFAQQGGSRSWSELMRDEEAGQMVGGTQATPSRTFEELLARRDRTVNDA